MFRGLEFSVALVAPGRLTKEKTKLLYDLCTTSGQRLRRWSNIVQMLSKCLVCLLRIDAALGYIPANTIHSPDVGSMLGQRRGQFPNIEPTSGECLGLLGIIKYHVCCASPSRKRHGHSAGLMLAIVSNVGQT